MFRFVKGPDGVGLWNNICNEWYNFAPLTRLEVRDGSCVLFWKDCWIGSDYLFAKYLELFCFARDKDSLVLDCVEWINGQIIWNPTFVTVAQDWRLSLWFCSRSYML